jgi:hypothetical protein
MTRITSLETNRLKIVSNTWKNELRRLRFKIKMVKTV